MKKKAKVPHMSTNAFFFRFRSRRGSLHLRLRGNFSGEVVDTLLDAFTEVEAREATDGNLLTNLRGRSLHELFDGHVRVLVKCYIR